MTSTAIKLISFGWGYLEKDQLPPPLAERVEDVRRKLRNPAVDPALLQLDGRDPRLQAVVLFTPGATAFLGALMVATIALPESEPRRIAIGCVAGRHRSVALVQMMADRLRQKDYKVTVTHLHLSRALANEPLHR